MKSFLIYAVRRIFLLIPFLIGLTILAFLLGVLAPGDPAMAVLIMDGTADRRSRSFLRCGRAWGWISLFGCSMGAGSHMRQWEIWVYRI